MPNILNRDFSGGWKPSSDSANAPPNILLRADNVELEDQGILSLRPGLEVQTDALSGDINVVQDVELNGSAVVLSASTTTVFSDGTDLSVGLSSTDDVAIDTVDGHALISSGSVHKKYDGSTVRNWGIEMPLEPPDVTSSALTSKIIADFTQASAEFTAAEGTISYVTGQDGVANAATGLLPAVGTGRAEMTYTFASTTNLLDFSGSEGGQFDLFEFWFDSPDPTKFLSLVILFGATASGSDAFQTDGYLYEFGTGLAPLGLTVDEVRQAQAQAAAAGQEEEPVTPPPPPPPPLRERDNDGPGSGTHEKGTPPGRENRG